MTDENPLSMRSKTKQGKFNEEINLYAEKYIAGELLDKISECVSGCCQAKNDKEHGHIINISYPAIFENEYIAPDIRLEIGPLASWVPFDEYEIKSYAAEEYPKLFSAPSCRVMAIKAERTFWEKATILHHEAYRPVESKQPHRYSRHYYDLAQMANTNIANLAINDLELLENVIEFKKQFYPRGWAKYDLAKPDTLKLVPPECRFNALTEDYEDMKDMIFGARPTFEEIIDTLQKLEVRINKC